MSRPWRNIWMSIPTCECKSRNSRILWGLFGVIVCIGLEVSVSEAKAGSLNEGRSPLVRQCFATNHPFNEGTAVACPHRASFLDHHQPLASFPQLKNQSTELEPLNLSLHESLLETIFAQENRWSDRPRPSHQVTIRNIEQQVFELVNQYRVDRGLSPLQLDDRISAYARQHSEAIATRQISFGHGGFSQRVDRIGREIRYRRIGENVAFNQGMMSPAQRALRGWLNSSTHRDNLGGRYDLTGIGVARDRAGGFYITQIFLRRR